MERLPGSLASQKRARPISHLLTRLSVFTRARARAQPGSGAPSRWCESTPAEILTLNPTWEILSVCQIRPSKGNGTEQSNKDPFVGVEATALRLLMQQKSHVRVRFGT